MQTIYRPHVIHYECTFCPFDFWSNPLENEKKIFCPKCGNQGTLQIDQSAWQKGMKWNITLEKKEEES